MNVLNVKIIGEKDKFVSKAAVDRFKKTVRVTKTDMIDATKYLKDGYTFAFESDIIGDMNVRIITIAEEMEINRIKMLATKKQDLRNRLKNAQIARSQIPKQKLASLKRSIPDKLFQAYFRLISKYQLPGIPAPDEVINNVDKYRTQIATVMGTLDNVSTNNIVSNHIKHYFTTLGEFLNIEPMNITTTTVQEPIGRMEPLGSDTEEEDAMDS